MQALQAATVVQQKQTITRAQRLVIQVAAAAAELLQVVRQALTQVTAAQAQLQQAAQEQPIEAAAAVVQLEQQTAVTAAVVT